MNSSKVQSSKTIRIDYPDDDVRQRVSRFLNSRHFPAFRDIEIEVDHGVVTLSGSVCTYYEKQVALTTCQRVAGVLSLVDDLSVLSTGSSVLLNTE